LAREFVLFEAVPFGLRLHGGAVLADAVVWASGLVGQDFPVMVVQIGLVGGARYRMQALADPVIGIEARPGAVGDQDICNRLLHNSLRQMAKSPPPRRRRRGPLCHVSACPAGAMGKTRIAAPPDAGQAAAKMVKI